MLLRAPCPSPRKAHAEARGGVGGQPAVVAAPRHAGGTRLLLEIQRQASPKMGFLNLCLHLRERSEMAAGAQRQQNRHPFPMVFIPSDYFFSPFQILLRGMDLSFFLWLSQPGGCGLTSPNLK